MNLEIAKWTKKYQHFMMDNLWIFPILLSIGTFTAEYIDHHHEGTLIQNSEFLREALIFSVLFPILFGVIVYYLRDVIKEREIISSEMNQLLILGRDLSKAEAWDEILEAVAIYLNRFISIHRIYLSVYNPELNRFQMVTAKTNGDPPEKNKDLEPEILECLEQIDMRSKLQGHIAGDVPYIETINRSDNHNIRYCFPLLFDDIVFAFILIDVPSGKNLTANQMDAFSTIYPEINMATAHVYSLEFYLNQSKSVLIERKKIARVLHDTLVQDITYLKLKLDLLREEDSIVGIIDVQRDLARMQSVAEDAYQQVRGTLENLVTDIPKDISQAIRHTINSFNETSNIEFSIDERGAPQPLPPMVRKKIINIAREALSNIEKHSQSSSADIEINWLKDEFTLRISDYGVGLSQDVCDSMPHYGIIFMQERADAINAELEIASIPGEGTTITLTLKLTPALLVST